MDNLVNPLFDAFFFDVIVKKIVELWDSVSAESVSKYIILKVK